MRLFSRIYTFLLLPGWTLFLLVNAILWTLEAFASGDTRISLVLVLVWVLVIMLSATFVMLLLKKTRVAGERLNIVTLVFSMVMTGGIYAIKAWNLFYIDSAISMRAGICSTLACLFHTVLLVYCIHARRGKVMNQA